jgi:hypothetical protein
LIKNLIARAHEFLSNVSLVQVLKNFLDFAEADVRSLISLYADVVSPVTVYPFSFLFSGCCSRMVKDCLLREEFSALCIYIYIHYVYTYTYSSNQLHLIYHFWFNFLFQGRNADSLSQYFGEDPSRCPFEQGLLFSP